MPEIKITQVKGFSCQDEKYPAENILTGGKWLSSPSRNVTSMSATFQLAVCCTINSVHIGNCGSAFISLSVSRAGYSDMKDLLPCSTLMTMQESKNGQNKNCVKIYNEGDFLKESRDEKWNQLRVTVNQPFNLHTQFGLCFVHVFSFAEEDSKDVEKPLDVSKWEKMKNGCSSSLSPRSSLSNKSLTRRDRLFLKAGQQPIRFPEEVKSVNEKENAKKVDEDVFEASAISFLESLKLTEKELCKIQFLEVRKQMEKIQGREFSTEEKQLLLAVVRKYMSSLKSSKSCSPDQSPYFDHNSKATNLMKGKSNEFDAASTSGWLTSKKGDSSDSNTERSPSIRRNVVSLEDTNETKETGHVLGGSSSKSERSKHVTKLGSVFLNKVKMLKRRASPTEDRSIKKFLTVENEKINQDLDDIKTESNKMGKKDLVECPICTVYFEANSIEMHSAECNTFIKKDDKEEDDDDACFSIPDVPCPVCNKLMTAAALDIHAIKCAAETFGD